MFSGIFAQYYAVACANLMTFIYGIAVGWPSASLPLLKSSETPLQEYGPLTLFEASWVSSVLCIGGAIGTLFYAWIASRYGRKFGIMSSFVPMIISWLLIEYGTTFSSLFCSRFLTGFAGGAPFQIVPLIVSEVSSVEIRGSLGSLLILLHNGGAIVGIALSSYTNFYFLPWIPIVLCFVFLLGYSFVPETPKYLMSCGKDASKSLKFFQGTDFDPKIEEKSEESYKMRLSDICEPATRKALIIGTILMNSVVFTGAFTLANYYETIFKEAGSSLSPSASSLVVCSIQFAGTCSASLTVERLGRKSLVLISAFSAAFLLAVMGFHSFLKTALLVDVTSVAWLPLVCLSLLVFVAANGATSIPFVIIGEIFAQNVRGPLVSWCVIVNWLMSFVAVLIFPYMMEYLKMYGALWVFSVIGASLMTIIAVIMPETKGIPIEVIVERLRGTKEIT
ncbi:facilitated trehalose transporter Tret1-2 homolog [Culicoides brevitarsis]|uniref:facilitated trehalose transporter Tret1-2 homolog n=1 Tax=Culicoides brevitarsis TaxID=469753 RepID=UPI00307C2AE0